METGTNQKPVIEITQAEWESRKLTKYGYYSRSLDWLTIGIIFSAIVSITFGILPNAINTPAISFWYAMIVLLAIQGLKKVERIFNPLHFYQTIVIREK